MARERCPIITKCVGTGQFISRQFISRPFILTQDTATVELGLGSWLVFGLGLYVWGQDELKRLKGEGKCLSKISRITPVNRYIIS